MKIDNYQPPKSSFLSINKDMRLLVDKILSNDRLCQLLYYTDKNSLEMPKLTDEQKIGVFGNNIKLVPKFYVDRPVRNYILIKFDNFVQSSNPEFRNNTIEFDIVCHFDQWQLKDFDLRPYRIAAELDSMLDKKKLTGIGLLEFYTAGLIMLNDEFGGICLIYKAWHGEEDKKEMLDKEQQEIFEQAFKEMIKEQQEIIKEQYPNGLQASLNDRD